MKKIQQFSFPREGDLFCLDEKEFFTKFFRLLGLPFIIFGAWGLLYWVYQLVFSNVPVNHGALFGGSFLFISGCLVSTLEFTRYLTSDGRMLIIRHRQFFIRWEEKQPLASFATIKLNRTRIQRERGSSSVLAYAVCLGTQWQDTELSSNTDYVAARSKAEQLVKHFQVPLEDASSGNVVVTAPERIDEKVSLLDVTLPDPPSLSSIRVTKDSDGLLLLLPSSKRIPFIAISRFVVFVCASAYFFDEVADISSDVKFFFFFVIAVIAIANMIKDLYPYFFKPWIKVSKDGIWCKYSPFKKKVQCFLDGIEDARVSKQRHVIIRSDEFYLDIPVHSHQEDAEFVRSIFLWLSKEGSTSFKQQEK
ncbi:MAG: hypothetical protein P1U57_12400 [Oleibacter sp.]|nr:hypothetical protein [Thalassolituus sp.]